MVSWSSRDTARPGRFIATLFASLSRASCVCDSGRSGCGRQQGTMRLAVLIGVVALAVAALPLCTATEARPFTSHPPIFTKRANMTTNEWFVVHRFGFKAGGTVDMHVQVESSQPAPDDPGPANANASVYSLVMCSRHAFSKLQPMSELPIAVGQVYPTLCSPSVRRLCTSYDFQAHPGSKLAVLALVETVNFDEMYYFVFSTCGMRMNTAYSSRPPTAFVQLRWACVSGSDALVGWHLTLATRVTLCPAASQCGTLASASSAQQKHRSWYAVWCGGAVCGRTGVLLTAFNGRSLCIRTAPWRSSWPRWFGWWHVCVPRHRAIASYCS